MTMKKILFLAIAAMMATMHAMAQTSLTGRVYHHPNIMASMFSGQINIDKEIAEARKKSIAETEKKKGRKLTQEETAELDKDIVQRKPWRSLISGGSSVRPSRCMSRRHQNFRRLNTRYRATR